MYYYCLCKCGYLFQKHNIWCTSPQFFHKPYNILINFLCTSLCISAKFIHICSTFCDFFVWITRFWSAIFVSFIKHFTKFGEKIFFLSFFENLDQFGWLIFKNRYNLKFYPFFSFPLRIYIYKFYRVRKRTAAGTVPTAKEIFTIT